MSGAVNRHTVASVFSPDDGQIHPDLCCSDIRPDLLCAVVREYRQGAPTYISPHLISNMVWPRKTFVGRRLSVAAVAIANMELDILDRWEYVNYSYQP